VTASGYGAKERVLRSGDTMTGELAVPDLKAIGLAGATAASRWVGATAGGAPVAGVFAKGDYVVDQAGAFWICTAPGTPGTWQQASGSVQSTVHLAVPWGSLLSQGTGSGPIWEPPVAVDSTGAAWVLTVTTSGVLGTLPLIE
jgi:hypothetical protein